MNNYRKRQELLILIIMVSRSFEAVKYLPENYVVSATPYRYLPHLNTAFQKAVPIKTEQDKERRRAMKVVNQIFNGKVDKLVPDLILWFSCQFLWRLVASGYVPPEGMMEQGFIQSMHNMGGTYEPSQTPPDNIIELLPLSVEMVRKFGLFLPRVK